MSHRHHNKIELGFKLFAIVGLVLLMGGVMRGEVTLSKDTLMFAAICVAALVLLD